MSKIGKWIRVIVALGVVIAVGYWAFNTVRERSYSGSDLNLKVGSGQVAVTNPGNEVIPVQMRAQGRMASFRVVSPEIDLNAASKRESSGRDAIHAVAFELPPGTTRINVTRGSNVYFVSTSDQRLNAVVTPMEAESVRLTLGVAGVIILIALYYLSRTLDHAWIGTVRKRLPRQVRGQGRPAA